ncbi:endonuclease 8-like 1 [Pogona vitticeps]
MPEGPELFLTSQYINTKCGGLVFSGKVEKSEVSKNPEVPFESDAYRISAVSRGKELKLTLAPIKPEKAPPSEGPAGAVRRQKLQQEEPMELVFRFGMSGSFKVVPVAEMPKHAHLRFYTREQPPRALCYVDFRRFGRWEVDGTWQTERGPCVMTEYEKFRENVLVNLPNKAFDKPICEALLNQKFFNGIGNYLRAEILYRLKIPPFEKARTVLEQLQSREQTSGLTLSKKVKLKRETPDLLELCHLVPMEVIKLGGKGYDPDSSEDSTAFEKWLQCYYVEGMKSLRDANGRTIWFQGDPGPMAPKGEKSRKKRVQVKSEPDMLSPKVKRLVARRNSRANVPPKGVGETKKPRRRRGSNTIKETEGGTPVNGVKTPKSRAKRKISPPQEPAVKSGSPAETQKRPTSARKKGVKAAAAARSRRVKPQ